MADSQKTLVIVGWLWPLPALPLFLWLTMEGVLNFGGGEKDILMVHPRHLLLLALLGCFLHLAAEKGVTRQGDPVCPRDRFADHFPCRVCLRLLLGIRG